MYQVSLSTCKTARLKFKEGNFTETGSFNASSAARIFPLRDTYFSNVRVQHELGWFSGWRCRLFYHDKKTRTSCSDNHAEYRRLKIKQRRKLCTVNNDG